MAQSAIGLRAEPESTSQHTANTLRHVLTNLVVHIRVGLSKRISKLAVFDARLYVRVRRIDETA